MSRSRFAIAAAAAALALQGFIGCGSDSDGDADFSNSGGTSSSGGSSASGLAGSQGHAGSSGVSGSSGSSGGSVNSGGSQGVDRDAGDPDPDASVSGDGGPPPPTDSGLSVYALECRGESKDCAAATVPCFGLRGDAGAIGYACANRCDSVADCSNAPTGAEAEVACIQLASAKHCLLLCKSETQEFACPDGMGCYVYPNSPIGYCLWMQ